MSLSQAMQEAQERARSRREAAAAALRQGALPVARRLNFDSSDEEPRLDEQQLRHDRLASEEQRRIQRGDAFEIRTRQVREIEENDRLQRRQPGHIPSGGKRRKSRKSRKVGGRKSRKVGGRKSRKSRKIRGGRKSRKVRRSRR